MQLARRHTTEHHAAHTFATRRGSLTLLVVLCLSFAAPRPASAHPPAQNSAAEDQRRDGQHDFDFHFGTWHTHIRRIADPFSAASKSMELDGTVTVRKVWDGRAQLEEIETDGPAGHWEGTTLFLYNPASRQWSQTFASSGVGSLTTPLIGSFHNGVGDLYAQDTFAGRSVLVRGQWSDIKPDSHRFTEFYSDDGGATWHPAFLAQLTRERP